MNPRLDGTPNMSLDSRNSGGPTPTDEFAHSNPAFGTACLWWFCRGYEKAADKMNAPNRTVSPVWGMLALALLAPQRTREGLPKTAGARLAKLIFENPRWKAAAPDAIQEWIAPFWDAVRLGVATGVLTLTGGRLVATGRVVRPASYALEFMKKATALGAIVAQDGADEALLGVFDVAVER
jgi:hypothetical protein